MTREEIKAQLKNIFANVKGKKIEVDVSENHRLGSDLQFDSLERVELLFGIEQGFSIKISDSEARELKIVKDIVDLIQDKTK